MLRAPSPRGSRGQALFTGQTVSVLEGRHFSGLRVLEGRHYSDDVHRGRQPSGASSALPNHFQSLPITSNWYSWYQAGGSVGIYRGLGSKVPMVFQVK
jgi:hypothetical protein